MTVTISKAQRMGDRIRLARLERGWSRAKLAARASVHPSYIGRLERGKYAKPSMGNLAAIANALGRSLFEIVDEPPPPTDDEVALLAEVRELIGTDEGLLREIVATVRSLDPDQRAGALRFTLQALQLAQQAPITRA